jgi:hypothetical protein
MPRGQYDRSAIKVPAQQAEVAVMDKDELQAVVDKNKDKVSPFTVADAGIKPKVGQAVPGTHRVRVGNFTKPALIGDPNTLKTFEHKPMTAEEYEEEGWVKMTWDEMYKYQEEMLLVGWDADAGYGLLKKQNPKRREK